MKFLLPAYGTLLLLFTIFSYAFVDPNINFLRVLFTGWYASQKPLISLIYVVCIILLFLLYFIISSPKRIKSLSLTPVIIYCSFLFFAYPAMLSYDIFNYTATAKVLYTYKENPYIVMPIEFPNDPMLLYTRAANKVALYGPMWIVLTSIPHVLAMGNFLVETWGIKLIIAAGYASSLYFIKKLSGSTEKMYLFALNPLVLIELFVSGHNDIVQATLLLFAFLLFKEKKTIWGSVVFFVACLVKYASFILLPVVFYILWKSKKKETVPWNTIFIWSSFLMFIIFLLSFFREEIYSWYAIWFLCLSVLIQKNRLVTSFFLAFSLTLLLSYVPYLFSGSYFGTTPILKMIIIFIPIPVITYFLYRYERP